MNDRPTYEDRGSARAYASANEMVDDYLRRFGESVGAELDALDEDGYTDVRRGSVTVGINVLEEHGILLFLSRIMDVPQSVAGAGGSAGQGREAFLRRLLELNFLVTSDAAFAIDKENDAVYLRALRRLSGLDFEEFEDLLHTMATVADEWNNRLSELFPD